MTRADLLDFRWEVLEAVRSGRVRPTEQDPFDVDDDVYGPSIYTVTEQLLKPSSAAAGHASWALRRHPEGLMCDVFVTHGWAEGVFEFVDKVSSSWPRGATAAYCCMLANPQTLDICSLVASPSSSPFARALHIAKTVLVVPNRRSSIYLRLWCVYEAFLACGLDKELYVATPPLGSALWAALVRIAAVGLVAGAALGLFVACLDTDADPDIDVPLVNAAAYLLCTQLRSPRWKAAANRLAATTASWLFLAGLCRPGHLGTALAGAVWVAVPTASEHQRFADARVEQEAELLAVCDAHCSDERDERNLRAAIVDKDAVVRAVAVLRRAGMSTSGLRAAAAVVDVHGAGRVNLAGLLFNWIL